MSGVQIGQYLGCHRLLNTPERYPTYSQSEKDPYAIDTQDLILCRYIMNNVQIKSYRDAILYLLTDQ